MADFVYIQQFGSRIFEPVFRMFKDGPLGDEMDDLILVLVQYGVFIGSYYASGVWGFLWTIVRELPFYQVALVTVVLGVGIHWLFFKSFSRFDWAYQKYRRFESQIWYWRGLFLWQL